MLILDKDLAVERMVTVASRRPIPDAFRRAQAGIESIEVPATGGSAPQRRLTGTLVLAGARHGSAAPAALDQPAADEPPPGSGATLPAEAAGPADVSNTPPSLQGVHAPPSAHPNDGEVASRAGIFRRLWGSVRTSPRHPAAGAAASPLPYRHRHAVLVRGWHAHPADAP